MKVFRLRPITLLLASLLGLSAAMADVGPGGGDAAALQWNWRIEAGSPSDEVTLVVTADIATGYIVYGSNFKSDLGPNPTRLRLAQGQELELTQALQSVNPKRRKDKSFGTEYTYFEGHAEFRQRLKVRAGATHVAGTVTGQSCHETDGTCTLFRQNFDLALK